MSYQRFLAELKRRKVFKVAAVYGIVAFVVLQVADLVLPTLAIPDWGMRLVLVLIILGFPIALIFAWAFETTPEGVKRTESAASGEITQIMSLPASRRWPSGLAALVGVGLLVFGAWWVGRRSAGAEDVAGDSGRAASADATDARAGDRSERTAIAVLPFENIAGDDESEYFVDGVHDEIITQLSKIGGLSVTSRTSVMAYKGKRPSLREIADELNVDVVLEGSVRHAPNRVRITAQLIDASTDEHLWADSYDRELTDILAIQSDVALKVADALEAQLTPEESARIEATLTDNLDAYDLYLRGIERLYVDFQEPALRAAEQLFLRATELDPSFAAAYAYLSIARGRLYWFFYDRSEEIEQATLAAAQRAVSLNPDLAAAQLADGMYHYRISLDYERALEALERAAELRPGSAEIEAATGWVYRRMGEWDEALRRMMDAQGRDPRDARFAFGVGETLFLMGDYEAAIRTLERTVELGPDRLLPHTDLALARLGADGNPVRALEQLDRARALDAFGPASALYYVDLLLMQGDDEAALEAAQQLAEPLSNQNFYRPLGLTTGLARTYAGDDVGARADFEAAAAELVARIAEQPDDPRYYSALGITYAGLGRTDEAVREARRAVDILPTEREAMRGPSHERDLAQVLTMTGAHEEAIDVLVRILGRPTALTRTELRLHPRWEPLRDNPRFQELVAER